MKVVFCNQLTEMLGVQILSACLKQAGHDAEVVFEPNLFATGAIKDPKLVSMLSNDGLVIEDILAEQPDLVGFPVDINGYHWALQIAAGVKARRPDLQVIFGGIHATMCPEVVIERPEVDYVAVGEAEFSLVELCDILDGKRSGDPRNVRGIWAREADGTQHRNPMRTEHPDLDDFPFYDKALYYDKLPGLASEYMTTISRGCPYNCTFCFYNAVHEITGARKVRVRSPRNVIDELVAAKARFPQMEAVLFHDDIFPVRTSWLEEFAPLYKAEVGLPYSCITYPLLVTERVAKLMGDSGCQSVIMGVQSTNPDIRAEVMERMETNDEIHRAIRGLRDNGIFVTVDHILGTPGETEQDQDDALLFYADADPSIIKPLPLTYLPRTRMTRIAIEQGLIGEQDEDDAAHGFLNSLMFKGTGYGTRWRPWFLAYGLRPLLPRDLFVRAVDLKLHRWLDKLLPGKLDPLIFFGPRMLNGALFGYDMRAKYLSWRAAEMLQYSLARKLRSRAEGLRSTAAPEQPGPTAASRLGSLLLRNRRRAEGTETAIPGAGLLSKMRGRRVTPDDLRRS
jgi:anaerobic magnesium-protoporphyrin IX monomethyl ester cyclase